MSAGGASLADRRCCATQPGGHQCRGCRRVVVLRTPSPTGRRPPAGQAAVHGRGPACQRTDQQPADRSRGVSWRIPLAAACRAEGGILHRASAPQRATGRPPAGGHTPSKPAGISCRGCHLRSSGPAIRPATARLPRARSSAAMEAQIRHHPDRPQAFRNPRVRRKPRQDLPVRP